MAQSILEPVRDRDRGGSLADVIEVILDKGLVINADITVSVAGVELLGIKIRAALASFATAARYGLEFPSGTNLEGNVPRSNPACPQPCLFDPWPAIEQEEPISGFARFLDSPCPITPCDHPSFPFPIWQIALPNPPAA